MKIYYIEGLVISGITALIVRFAASLFTGTAEETDFLSYLIAALFGMLMGLIATILYMQFMVKFMSRKQVIYGSVILIVISGYFIFSIINGSIYSILDRQALLIGGIIEVLSLLLARYLYRKMFILNTQLKSFKENQKSKEE